MKKIFSLLVILAGAATVMAQPGRIRISFVGFDCYRETWDDILHADGKGDEVFFTFNFTLADKNGNSKLNYEKRTSVYGDATGQFSNRISAGSFVDLFGNNKGGIKAGDIYRCNDLIGEYDMADGDILTIVPVGWEHDPIADNSLAFSSTIRGLYNSINQKVAPVMIGFNVLTGNLGGVIFSAASLGLSKIKAGGDQGELGRPGTRPIGMEKYGDFTSKLVVLNTANLNTICNSNMGFGNGVISVNYDEAAVGNLRDHGNYSILLKIEFIPKQNTNPAPPPSGGNNSNIPPPPPPSNNSGKSGGFKMTNLPPATNSVTGTWKGTYGSGQNNGPNFYSFKLNADGIMQVVDANNAVIASGTYSFSNNQFNGTYKYNTSGTFSVAATLDAAGSLNGTWGSGTNTTGGGKWVMNKATGSMTGNIR
ncbi:MAG: hypothetical protein JNN00_08330 [Chitinophagaceae bacterium]|nr:hypothetical protein [Chitinophagaceae bacterium]